MISSSSRIAFRTHIRTSCKPTLNYCHGAVLTYRWNLFRQEGNRLHPQWKRQTGLADLLATKVDSKNLVLKIIAPGFSYRLTVDVLSPEGARGWAAYHFETSAAPSGGTCFVTKLGREDTLRTSLNITCQGWTDKSEHLMYQFYRKMEDGRFNLLSYESLPHGTAHILPATGETFVHVKVAIINVLGSATEELLQIQVRTLVFYHFLGEREESLYTLVISIQSQPYEYGGIEPVSCQENYFSEWVESIELSTSFLFIFPSCLSLCRCSSDQTYTNSSRGAILI